MSSGLNINWRPCCLIFTKMFQFCQVLKVGKKHNMNIGFLVEVFLELWHETVSGWRQAPAYSLHVRKPSLIWQGTEGKTEAVSSWKGKDNFLFQQFILQMIEMTYLIKGRSFRNVLLLRRLDTLVLCTCFVLAHCRTSCLKAIICEVVSRPF